MIDVVMPQMGESIVEGTLTRWLKKPGDRVERDEPLFEISTDKVDTEIPAPSAGILGEILVQEGTTVGINTIVGRINTDGTAAASPASATAPSAPAPAAAPVAPAPAATTAAPTVVSAVGEEAGPLSPLVRKMARENQIDLSKVKGTGAGGRITKQDLEQYLNGRSVAPARARAPEQAAPPPPPPATPTPTPVAVQQAQPAPHAPPPPPTQAAA